MSSVHESALYNTLVAAKSLGYDLDELFKKLHVGLMGSEMNFAARATDKSEILDAVKSAINEVKDSP